MCACLRQKYLLNITYILDELFHNSKNVEDKEYM